MTAVVSATINWELTSLCKTDRGKSINNSVSTCFLASNVWIRFVIGEGSKWAFARVITSKPFVTLFQCIQLRVSAKRAVNRRWSGLNVICVTSAICTSGSRIAFFVEGATRIEVRISAFSAISIPCFRNPIIKRSWVCVLNAETVLTLAWNGGITVFVGVLSWVSITVPRVDPKVKGTWEIWSWVIINGFYDKVLKSPILSIKIWIHAIISRIKARSSNVITSHSWVTRSSNISTWWV